MENLKTYTKIVAYLTPFVVSGHAVLFATLTMQHPIGEPLASQVESWRQAWEHFTKKGVLTKKKGVRGYVARFEPGKQGDNLHVHILVVIARDSSATEVEQRIRNRWQRSCHRAERSCTRIEFRQAGSPEAITTFAQYMTKECPFDTWPADQQRGYVRGLRGFRMTRSSLSAPKQVRPKREWLSARDLDAVLTGGQHSLELVAALSAHLPKLIAWSQEHDQTDLKDKLARFIGWRDSSVTTRNERPLVHPRPRREQPIESVHRLDGAEGAYIADYSIPAAPFIPEASGTGRIAGLLVDHRAGVSVAARSKLLHDVGDGLARELENRLVIPSE